MVSQYAVDHNDWSWKRLEWGEWWKLCTSLCASNESNSKDSLSACKRWTSYCFEKPEGKLLRLVYIVSVFKYFLACDLNYPAIGKFLAISFAYLLKIFFFSGKFVTVKGTVVRVSNIKPMCTQMAFECQGCGYIQVGKVLIMQECYSKAPVLFLFIK